MNKEEPFHEGTLDWYREIAKHNPDIAALVRHIDRQERDMIGLIEALTKEHAKRMAAAKILASDAA